MESKWYQCSVLPFEQVLNVFNIVQVLDVQIDCNDECGVLMKHIMLNYVGILQYDAGQDREYFCCNDGCSMHKLRILVVLLDKIDLFSTCKLHSYRKFILYYVHKLIASLQASLPYMYM